MQDSVTSHQYLHPVSNYNNGNIGSVNNIMRRSQGDIVDSDDENPLGPPKLSNFGSALFTDKENETPTYLRKSGVVAQPAPYPNINMNANKPPTLTGTLHMDDGSHSTLFTSVSKHQPSMTTVNQEQRTPGEEGLGSYRFQMIQQSMKDELSSRQIMRRSRRFITSRLSTLGPAKRNTTLTANLDFSSNMSHEDSRDLSHQDGNISSSSNNHSGLLQNQDYNVFLDTEPNCRPDSKENDGLKSASSIDYENISFGDLNPYQYLKKHNLPTSELPNISRIYFEIQKKENRRAAMRKNIFTNNSINSSNTAKDYGGDNKHNNKHNNNNNNNNETVNNNNIGNIHLNISNRNGNQNRNNHGNTMGTNKWTPTQTLSVPKRDRQPRRKTSDASVSSFSKILSSPITGAANNYVESQKQIQPPMQRSPVSLGPLQLNPNTKKREALNKLDVNSTNQQAIVHKKHKSDEQNFYHIRKAPNPPAVKKVEIIEPVKDTVITTIPLKPPSTENGSYQTPQRKRQIIQVNGSEYEKVELLGRGGSSKVYKVRSSNNKIYALKRVSFDEFDDTSIDGFKGEIELLKRLEDQTRVVKLIDHEMNHGVLYVVMECGDHDLSQVLAQRANMPFDIEFVRYHAQEMLKCVQVVHDTGIVHSDLKPANFVFVKGILKIIDFGIANAVPDHTVNIYRDTQIGTPNYMAPEALVAMNYTPDQGQTEQEIQQNRWKVGKPSDIWSCGCIIYQMIYGRPPYGGFQGQNRLLAIMNPEVKIVYPEKTTHGDLVPRTALDTIKACLERNPERRWTVDDLLRGPFIKPVSVTHFFIRDLIKNAVKYGSDQRYVSKEKVEDLADDVWNRLSDFRL